MNIAHPFWWLRRNSSAFRYLTREVRIPYPAPFALIDHRVYVDILRNPRLFTNPNSYEAEDLRIFVELVREHSAVRFFDVGANVGLFSFAFLTEAKQGTAIAFEPDPVNLSYLRRTEKRYKSSRLEIVIKAVSDAEGTVDFVLDEMSGATGTIDRSTSSFNKKTYGLTDKTIQVETTTIDKSSQLFGKPDIIKIDVEGAEIKVLNGSVKTLTDFRPIVIIEVSQRTYEYTKSFLERYRYCVSEIRGSVNLLGIPIEKTYSRAEAGK